MKQIILIAVLVVVILIVILWAGDWLMEKFSKKVRRTALKGTNDVIIPKTVTYVAGITFCLGLTLFVLILVGILLPSVSFGGKMIWYKIPVLALVSVCSLGITLAFLFFERIAPGVVPIARTGVLFFLGGPIPGPFVLGVGDNWLPPFFTLKLVDISEQIQDIPETAEEQGFIVETLGVTNNPTGTGGKAGLIVRLGIRWQVVSSKTFLIFDDNSGGKKVKAGIRIKSTSSIRQQGAKMDNETFMSCKDDIANGTIGIINSSAKAWGINVEEVSIPKATDQNPEVSAARERTAIENSQRAGEIIENTHVRNLIASTAKSLVDAGMRQEEAAREAVRLVKVERGKATEIYVGGNSGDFTKGEAVRAAFQKQKGT